jgi:Na+-driven multidrug efflux pump
LLPRLLGEAYRASAEVWRVQVWTLVFVSIVSLRSRLWVVEGRTIWILVLAAITAALNLAGDWWLIPKMGAMGAAWSAVVAWGISALILPWMAAGPSQSMRRWCGLAKLE